MTAQTVYLSEDKRTDEQTDKTNQLNDCISQT